MSLSRFNCVVAALGVVGIIAACTGGGDDTGATSTPDGGGSSTSSSGNLEPDGGTPVRDSGGIGADGGASFTSCFGTTFTTPVAVNVTLPDLGASTKIEQVRVAGASAVYARTDTGAAPTYVFESDYTAGSPPTLGGTATAIVAPHLGESDLAPTISPRTGVLMFTHGEIGQRVIWTSKTDAGTGASAGLSDGLSDDADPYLVFTSTLGDGHLYFGRGHSDGSAMRIVYAQLTTSIGVTTFDPVVTPTLPCPAAANDNCGKPVVTPDETMMLFASWSASLSPSNFAIHEIALTEDSSGAITAGATTIDHPELGARAVSWVSDDGCQVLLDGGLTNPGIFYASRTAQVGAH